MCSESRSPDERPNLRAVVENMRQPMPWGRKLRLVLRNNWIKLRTRSDCCGNYGQPGC